MERAKLSPERRLIFERCAEALLRQYHAGMDTSRPSLWAEGWRFEWSRATTRSNGSCWYGKKIIKLSMGFSAQREIDMVANTLRHEIGHAVVGPNVGHGPEWQALGPIIGYVPEPCTYDTTADMVARNKPFMVVCRGCALTLHRTRSYGAKLVRLRCSRCGCSFDEIKKESF